MALKQIFFCVILLGCVLPPASACRPFGSYQFAEDSEKGIWFTEGDNNSVSRLAPDGTVTAHLLPTPQSEPSSLALGASGVVWFVAADVAKIGRIEPDGTIVEYATRDGHPGWVAVDHKGDAWFTQMAGNESGRSHNDHSTHRIAKVGRIDTSGQIHSYPTPQGWPTSIAFDKQGDAWVTLLVPGIDNQPPAGMLTQLKPSGEWTTVEHWKNSCPGNLVGTPEGELVFSDHCREIFGRISAQGQVSSHLLPKGTYIQQLSASADGTLWFTGDEKGRLGRIDQKDKVSFVNRPKNGDQTMAILATSDGDVIFSEFYNYNINRLKHSGEFVEHLINVDDRRQVRKITRDDVCLIRFATRIASKSLMDKKRAEEVRNGRFTPDGKGTEELVKKKCLVCHDARRLLLSRRSDWTPSIERMGVYRDIRDVEPLTDAERQQLVTYFNEYYSIEP